MNSNSEIETALKQVGRFGRAQVWMVATTMIVQTFCGWPSIVAVFFSIEVPFRCANFTIGSTSANETEEAGYPEFDNVCRPGCELYVYDTKPSSIIADFDLACGDGPFWTSSANSVFWIGFLISCFISGPLSDTFGRRTVSLATCLGYLLFTTILPASQNIYEFITIRFFCGLFHYPLTAIVYILFTEWIDPEKLATLALTSLVCFDLGAVVCAVFGHLFIYSWRLQLLVISAGLCFVTLLIYLNLPESARWLYEKKKFDKCMKVLHQVSKRNQTNFISLQANVNYSNDYSSLENEVAMIEGINTSAENEHTRLIHPMTSADNCNVSNISSEKGLNGCWSLFQTTRSFLLMVFNISAWFSSSLIYFGLAFNVSALSGNVYLNCALLGLTGIPSWFVCIPMDKLGRKSTYMLCLFITSFACLFIPIANNQFPTLSLVLALFGKAAASAGFGLLFVYTPEQLPTALRSSGTSICSAGARIATITAPFIIQADIVSIFIPYTIIATCGFISFGICLFIAIETLNKPPLETVKQYLEFANKNR